MEHREFFFWKKSGDNYYITWADGRPGTDPGNSDIYVQKFDENGTVHWTENGVLAISLNTYIPYPKFELRGRQQYDRMPSVKW
jgi:hypothetical protein